MLSSNDAQILALAGLGFEGGSLTDLQNRYFQALADIAVIDITIDCLTTNNDTPVTLAVKDGYSLPDGITIEDDNKIVIDKSYGPATIVADTFEVTMDFSEASSKPNSGSTLNAYYYAQMSQIFNAYRIAGDNGGSTRNEAPDEEVTSIDLQMSSWISLGVKPFNADDPDKITLPIIASGYATEPDGSTEITDGHLTGQVTMIIKHFIP